MTQLSTEKILWTLKKQLLTLISEFQQVFWIQVQKIKIVYFYIVANYWKLKLKTIPLPYYQKYKMHSNKLTKICKPYTLKTIKYNIKLKESQ